MSKELSERYLLRWTTYKELKRNGLEQTKIQRLKDGTYKTYAHFERKGKYFLRVTKWKFLKADKTYSKITQSWNEHSYEKIVKKELRKFRGSQWKEFDAGVQKFKGKIISARNRKIQGKISRSKYIKTNRNEITLYDSQRFTVELTEQMENIELFQYDSFLKVKRKRKKKVSKKNVRHTRRNKRKNNLHSTV